MAQKVCCIGIGLLPNSLVGDAGNLLPLSVHEIAFAKTCEFVSGFFHYAKVGGLVQAIVKRWLIAATFGVHTHKDKVVAFVGEVESHFAIASNSTLSPKLSGFTNFAFVVRNAVGPSVGPPFLIALSAVTWKQVNGCVHY